MNTKEKVYLNILNELRERLEKRTEYDVLKTSGLIRQLLIDRNSLINQINKIYRIKIKYIVQKRFEFPKPATLPDGSQPQILFQSIFILPGESTSVEELLLQDFLKYELLYYEEKGFSVLDIIKICANKYGGIHFDDVKKESDLTLDHLNRNLIFNNSSSVLQSMHDIAQICLIALKPLEEIIKKKYSY